MKVHLKRLGLWDGPIPRAAARPPEGRAPRPAIDPAQLRDAVKPPQPGPVTTRPAPAPAAPSAKRTAHREGDASARQRKDLADAQMKEMKLAEMAGELIRADDVKRVVTAVFASLAGQLDAMPDEITRRGGLREDAVPPIRLIIDDIRADMVRQLEPLLADGAGVAPSYDPTNGASGS